MARNQDVDTRIPPMTVAGRMLNRSDGTAIVFKDETMLRCSTKGTPGFGNITHTAGFDQVRPLGVNRGQRLSQMESQDPAGSASSQEDNGSTQIFHS